jgi:hypothetical protein
MIVTAFLGGLILSTFGAMFWLEDRAGGGLYDPDPSASFRNRNNNNPKN